MWGVAYSYKAAHRVERKSTSIITARGVVNIVFAMNSTSTSIEIELGLPSEQIYNASISIRPCDGDEKRLGSLGILQTYLLRIKSYFESMSLPFFFSLCKRSRIITYRSSVPHISRLRLFSHFQPHLPPSRSPALPDILKDSTKSSIRRGYSGGPDNCLDFLNVLFFNSGPSTSIARF